MFWAPGALATRLVQVFNLIPFSLGRSYKGRHLLICSINGGESRRYGIEVGEVGEGSCPGELSVLAVESSPGESNNSLE